MKAGLGRVDHVKLVSNVEQGQHAKCKMVIFKINLLQQAATREGATNEFSAANTVFKHNNTPIRTN